MQQKCVQIKIGGGNGDWFLPSKDELYLINVKLKQNDLGGFLARSTGVPQKKMPYSHGTRASDFRGSGNGTTLTWLGLHGLSNDLLIHA